MSIRSYMSIAESYWWKYANFTFALVL